MSTGSSSGFDSALNLVRNITLTYKNTAGDGSSIADIGKLGYVEPITLVASTVKTMDAKTRFNIEHGILNYYASMYVRAMGLLATRGIDTNILKTLDSLNPDRDLATVTAAITSESSNGLVKLNSDRERVTNTKKYLALEALDFGRVKNGVISTESTNYAASEVEAVPSVDSGLKVNLDVFEKDQYTVGKVIDASFQVGDRLGQTVTLPIVIKLGNMIVPSEVIQNIVTMNEDSIRIGARFKDALSGRISFIKDFILANDLIEKQRTTMMKDPSRAYEALLARVNSSKFYSILSRNISLSTISGILIMTEVENNAIKRELGGDLTNRITRKKVFDNSSVMIIAVIDREWEQVSVFIRGFDDYSTIPFSGFSDAKNTSSDAIQEIVKTMSMGKIPSF